MMNYQEFKEQVKEHFLEQMPQKYSHMQVIVREVNKTNTVLDGLSIFDGEEGISPTLYINDMYEHYQECKDFNEVLKKVAQLMDERFKYNHELKNIFQNKKNIKESVFFQLINTELNKEMLKGVPHREFFDLSIVYWLEIKGFPGGIVTTKITNSLAEESNITEEELYEAALENTGKMYPYEISDVSQILSNMFRLCGFDEEIIKQMDLCANDSPLYVISNKCKSDGATAMLYTDILESVAKEFGSDMYIIPSTIDEIIVLPKESMEIEDVEEMVYITNSKEVPLKKRLSNNVYLYSRNDRKVTMVTDSKRSLA